MKSSQKKKEQTEVRQLFLSHFHVLAQVAQTGCGVFSSEILKSCTYVGLGILLVQGLDHVVPKGLSTILLLSEYQLSEEVQIQFISSE